MEVLGFLCSHLYVVFLIAARGHVSSKKSRFQPGTYIGIVKVSSGVIVGQGQRGGSSHWLHAQVLRLDCHFSAMDHLDC